MTDESSADNKRPKTKSVVLDVWVAWDERGYHEVGTCRDEATSRLAQTGAGYVQHVVKVLIDTPLGHVAPRLGVIGEELL